MLRRVKGNVGRLLSSAESGQKGKKMNRNGLVILLALVLVGACGYAFFVMSQDTEIDNINDDSASTEIGDGMANGPRTSVGRSSPNTPRDMTPEDNASTDKEDAQEGLAMIIGRAVKQRDKTPMPSLEVLITTIVGAPVANSQTEEDGTFKVKNLPLDIELSFKIIGNGFASKAQPGIFLVTDQELDLGDIELLPSTAIMGKVTSGGKNLAKAHVALLPNVSINFANLDVVAILRNMTRDDDPLGLTMTDDSGNFIFENIVPGEYAVAVTADGKEFKHSEKITVQEGAAMKKLVIDLLPGCTIKGTIKDENGIPIPDALIAVLRDSRGGMPTVFKTLKTRSDGNGRFEFTQLGKSRYNYMIRAVGFASIGEDFNVEEKDNKDLEIVMKKGIIIRGKVTLEGTGEPIAGAEVITFENNAPMSTESISDADGNYELKDITPEGRLMLIVQHNDYKLVIPKKTGRDFMPFAAIQIKVTGDEGPVITKDITMTGGGTVKGQVIDQDSGKGIANAKVTVTAAESMGTFSSGGGATAMTDAMGNYSIDGVKPGKFSVQAKAAGYYSEKAPLMSGIFGARMGGLMGNDEDQEDPLASLPILANGATLTGQNVTLIAGVTVKGQTFDTKGKPLAGATVEWSQTDTGDNESLQAAMMLRAMAAAQEKAIVSDKEGNFVIKGIKRDVGIEVKATHPSYGGGAKVELVAAVVGKKDVLLTLQPGIRLYGQVTGPKGPAANLEVSIRSMDRNRGMMEMMSNGGQPKTAVTNSSGRYSAEGLAGGKYQINVDSEDGYEVEGGNWKTIELVAGRDKEYDIVLKTVAVVKGVVVDTAGKPVRNVQLQMTPEDVDPKSNERWRHMKWGNSNRSGEFTIRKAVEGVTYKIRATYNLPQETEELESIVSMVDPSEEDEEGTTDTVTWTTLVGVKAGDLEVRIVLDMTGLKKK
ncbi:MAG: protocatechuate 3,4-dioxygenase beta subunit [Planctomycetota bacterium]|jgi:protocatechuate 3,4-dioxygenase beta subunit